jgi:hypothetical protein
MSEMIWVFYVGHQKMEQNNIQNHCTCIFLKHQQMKKNIVKHIVHVFCIR